MKVCICLGGVFSDGGMLDYAIAWAFQEVDSGNQVDIIIENSLKNSFSQRFPSSVNFIILPYENSDGLIKTYLNSIIALLTFNKQYRLFKKKVKGSNYNKLHIIDETIFFPVLIFLLSADKKIITIHDLNYHPGQFRSVGAYFASKLSRLFIRFSNFTIHFHSMRLWQGSSFNINRCLIEAHPLPPKLPNCIRNKNKNVFRIGLLGRLEPYKGLDLILEISKRLKSESFKYEIEIAGSGQIDPLLLFAFDQDQNIKITNKFLDTEDFHSKLVNLDLLILPYTSATQSGVLYLALSYNVPVLAFDVGAFIDVSEKYKSVELVNSGNKVGFINIIVEKGRKYFD